MCVHFVSQSPQQEFLDRKSWWKTQICDIPFLCWETMLTNVETRMWWNMSVQQCVLPAPLCSLSSPDLLLDLCIHFCSLPRLISCWRNDSTLLHVAPSLLHSLDTCHLLRDHSKLFSQVQQISLYICVIWFSENLRAAETVCQSITDHLIIIRGCKLVRNPSLTLYRRRWWALLRHRVVAWFYFTAFLWCERR